MGNTFGERLRELREMKGVSQHKVARDTGISQTVISQVERGVYMPNIKAIETLAKYFGATSDYLMHGKPEKMRILVPYIEGKNKPQVTMFEERESCIEKIGDLPESKATHTLDECKKIKPLVYRAEDGRKLDDINLMIRHLRDMHISKEEKVRLHKRLSQMRTEVESVVLFGEE